MALKPCPDCGERMSELAPECRNCGRSLRRRSAKDEGDRLRYYQSLAIAGSLLSFGILLFTHIGAVLIPAVLFSLAASAIGLYRLVNRHRLQ